MILTVTPNPCVDRTYRVEQFALDCVNRPSLTYVVAGGKGINVARVFQTLGGAAVTTGLLAGANGGIVARALHEERIESHFVTVPGETRVCIAVVDPVTGTQTEINEAGPEVGAGEIARLKRKLRSLLRERAFEFACLCGSLPPGAAPNTLAEMARAASARGARVCVDSSREALAEALKARPWMAKPNRAELEWLVGEPLAGERRLLTAARSIRSRYGLDVLALTLGAEGALLLTERGSWRGWPPPIRFVSAVASGDSFLAALLYAWSSGAGEEPALRLALAAGAANASVIGAGLFQRSAVCELEAGVRVQKLDG